MRLLSCLVVPQIVSALAISQRDPRYRAAYFLDNNPNGSSIVALKIDSSTGLLSDPMRTSTGGKGLQALAMSAMPGVAPAPGAGDSLFGQDAVVVSGDYLFTVNSGSNTVAMFAIGENPTWPKLINTTPSLGDFPMAVAYSSKLNIACVVNGGAIAGVACFAVDHLKGLSPLGSLRPIALNQTTPPVGPPGTISDIVFNPSATALFVTIKGHPPTPGFIYVYPIITTSSSYSPSYVVSTTPKIFSPADLIVDFSINFLGTDERAVITDASYGASIISIAPDFSNITVVHKVVLPKQAATCWSAYSPRFNAILILDGGNSNITLLDPATGAVKGVAVQSAAGKGSFDTAIDRDWSYTLKGSSSVAVSDLTVLNHGKMPVEVQSYDLSMFGARATWTGMAIYPSS